VLVYFHHQRVFFRYSFRIQFVWGTRHRTDMRLAHLWLKVAGSHSEMTRHMKCHGRSHSICRSLCGWQDPDGSHLGMYHCGSVLQGESVPVVPPSWTDGTCQWNCQNCRTRSHSLLTSPQSLAGLREKVCLIDLEEKEAV
jgi:hypothetical protein